MTCRELAEFIAAYLRGDLPLEIRAQFERHLAECPNCVAYLSNYRETIALGRRVFADGEATVPDDVPEDLVQAILASRRAPS